MNNQEFENAWDDACRNVANVEGFLSKKEMHFVFLLGAVQSCQGEILEIGSFKGRSTILLSKAAALANENRVVAVDPLTSPSVTDPDLKGKASGWEDFQRNLKTAGVEKFVEFHRMTSFELAKQWELQRKIRMLWIDGDHTYRGAKMDFDLFRPFLADGAIVAMHDVLHGPGGPARVFAEDILLSPHFGPFGFSGSIGWSQFCESPKLSQKNRAEKLRMYRKLARIISLTAFGGGNELRGFKRFRFRVARALIPHGNVSFDSFRRRIQSSFA